MDEQKYNFTIKFEKDQHSISADTYVQSLISLSTIIREVNYQQQGAPVAVNVVAEEAGSFEVVLQLVEVVKDNWPLIAGGGVFLAGVVGTAVDVLDLKKHLSKADESKTEISGDQVNIKDTNGDVIFQTNNVTYNLYMNNQAINDAVSNQFKAVSDDNEMSGVTITAGDNKVEFGREDFEDMSKKRIVTVDDKEEVVVPAQLTISKLVLDNQDRKWEFVYQGRKMGAKVTDEEFWAKIFAGQIRFANGDVLVADLRIVREYDQNLGAYLDSEYFVQNIRQHLPRSNADQLSLDVS